MKSSWVDHQEMHNNDSYIYLYLIYFRGFEQLHILVVKCVANFTSPTATLDSISKIYTNLLAYGSKKYWFDWFEKVLNIYI
jgi:hypothetical protein